MDIGNVLLVAAAILSLGAAFVRWFDIDGRSRLSGVAAKVLGVSAFLMVTAALSMLIWMALGSDFTYHYVWAHSSTAMAPVYRASSIWAGGEGALLLCAWAIGLVLVTGTFVLDRRGSTDTRFRGIFSSALSLLLFVFSAMVLMAGLFDRTTDAQLSSTPGGQGMDLLLLTPEMVVHAPVIFGSYACLAALFSAALAHLMSGEERWADTALLWGRLGWLLLTTGIVVGAVWAYYAVGWGGYWAWDPVETSSLLPWLMATAFLHTQMRRPSGNEYRLASPSFALLSFVGVVFVSFIVRAGGLWVSSVHDYGSATASSAVSRLVSLLKDDPSVAGTFAFLLTILSASVLALVLAQRKAPRASPPPKVARLAERVNDRDSMFLAVVLMAMSAVLAAILLFKDMDSSQADMYAEFDQKMSVLFVALMVAMSLCLTWRWLGRERALWASVALVVVSVVLAAASAVSGWSDPLVSFSLPSYVVATAASGARLASSLRSGGAVTRMYRSGAQVAHLGVALVLVGFVVSSGMQTYPVQGYEVAMPVGTLLLVGDYSINLLSVDVSGDVTGYPAGVAQVRTAVVEISRDGRVVEGEAALEVLYGYDSGTGYYVLETVPCVRSTPLSDLYLSYEWMSDGVVIMHAKVVPLMVSLWAGAALLCAGMSLRLLSWRADRRPLPG